LSRKGVWENPNSYKFGVPIDRQSVDVDGRPAAAGGVASGQVVVAAFKGNYVSTHAATPATPLGRLRSWCGCLRMILRSTALPEACQSTPATSPPAQWDASLEGPLTSLRPVSNSESPVLIAPSVLQTKRNTLNRLCWFREPSNRLLHWQEARALFTEGQLGLTH
jgi:hypothetical protein